jgi:hypothetical protein
MMQNSIFSSIDENIYCIIPKIQEKITGKKDLYHFFEPNNLYYHILNLLPTPIGHFLIRDLVGYYNYTIFVRNKSDKVLSQMSMFDTTELRQVIKDMQQKIQIQSYIYSMELHQWNDSYALLAKPDSPFTPVFVPSKIIDCQGIKAIKENPIIKNHFLTSVNHHLKLSSVERVDFFETYSVVRTITEYDCQNAHLSHTLIGQQGVFARIDLPQYFFLGFYSGYYFANPTEANAYFDKMGSGIDVYLFGHKNQERPIVSAYRGGNRISLINSATDYSGTAKDIAYQLFYVQNTLPLDFKTLNNPDDEIRNSVDMFDMSGYVTIKPVKAGTQLLVDYGYDYWHNHCLAKSNHFTQATLEEINDAYSLLQ